MANYNSSHTGAEIDSAIGRVKDTAVTAGTISANLGVVVDANKDISGFRNVTLTGQLQAATINLTGDTTIGDGDSDNITINADVNSNIIPNTDNTFDLGSASKQWKDLYVNGIGYIDQLGTDADPIAIYASSGEIDGIAIGSESASTGAFTTLTASDAVTVTKAITGSSGDNFLLNIVGTEASGTDLGAGDNVGILFKTAYETTTSKIGSAIVATRESADDTISSTGLAFKVSQNDETLDTALTIDSSQNSTFAGDLTVPHKIIHDGDTDTYIRYLTDNIVLYTGGAQRLDVNSSRVYITDSLGVGVSSPAYALDVRTSSGTASLQVRAPNDADARIRLIADNQDDNADNFQIIHTASDNDIEFQRWNGSAWRSDLIIDSSGNVGIGTTSPGSYNSNADNLVIHETGDFTGITLSADNDQGSNIYFADPQDDNVGGITYNHTSNYMNFRVNGAEKMRIDSSGDVTLTNSLYMAGGSTGRILFNSQRAMEGTTNNTLLSLGEDYTDVRVRANFIPDGDNTRSIGSTSARFNKLHIDSILFHGDTASANELDDYEEGTYTINITGTTADGWNNKAGYATAQYVKIGSLVTVTARYETSSADAGRTGTLRYNLPFTVADLTDQAGGAAGSITVNRSGFALTRQLTAITFDGVAYFNVQIANESGATESYIDASDIDGTFEGHFSITYRAA